MKRVARIFSALLVLGVVLSVFSLTAFAENTAYEIDELKMSISFPDDMVVATRDGEKTDKFFTDFDIDYKETMNSFQEDDIYLQAVKDDSSLTVTVSMTQTDDSRIIENYNKLSAEQLGQIKDNFLKNEGYKSGAVVEYNGTTYISLFVSSKSGKKIVQAQQCNAVVNGRSIVITLQAAVGEKLNTDDKELFVSILEGTAITEDSFFSDYHDLIIYGGATLIGVIIVAVVLVILLKHFKNPQRKNRHLIHDLAHEHKITETTQIPNKRIKGASRNTMSFLTNYAPVEELSEQKAKAAAARAQRAKAVSEDSPEPKESLTGEAAEVQGEAEHNIESAEAPKSGGTEEISEAYEQEPAETVQAQSEENFKQPQDYFDSVPEKEEMYSYSDVDTAVDEYSVAKKNARRQQTERSGGETAGRVLRATGRGLAGFFGGVWMVICYVVIHCKYFCINLSRLIRRKHSQRKRRKAGEEKRRKEEELRRRESLRRRAQREAERNRRIHNAQRGEDELVKVHSSGEPRHREYRDSRNRTRRY